MLTCLGSWSTQLSRIIIVSIQRNQILLQGKSLSHTVPEGVGTFPLHVRYTNENVFLDSDTTTL